MTLVESYKQRLNISEAVYKKAHNGEDFTDNQKITVARVLANSSAFLTEAFSNSTGTQRSDMGSFKKFVLDITTVALPSLIANKLVIVKPMSAITGYIQYLSFTAGSNKGTVKQGDVFNSPFALGAMDEGRMNYTADKVVELIAPAATEFAPAWTPVVGDKVELLKKDGTTWESKALVGGKVTGLTAGDYTKARYIYNNVDIPQNDLPILNAKMTGIALEAKARRIAVYYSQMAAFQAKIETGTDLGKVLTDQACAELAYEIDSEVVKTLDDGAGEAVASTTFNKRVPAGVSTAEHYEGFAAVVEQASQIIYDRTQRYGANYLVCASDVKTLFPLMRGWKASENIQRNGPYFAGTLNGIEVYVSPIIEKGRFFVGFNGEDLRASAAVYAPFMAIVPTQLLGYADGGMSQGFSTMYDIKLLNPALLVAGKVVDEDQVVLTKVAD